MDTYYILCKIIPSDSEPSSPSSSLSLAESCLPLKNLSLKF